MNTRGVSAGPVATTSPGRWLMCRVGDRMLAVPLACVVETMRPMPLRAFAGVPDFVLGVSVIRGEVVPVVDLLSVLGVRGGQPGRFVTISLDDRVVALAVDEVLGVRALDEVTMQDVPPLLGALEGQALSAIGTLDAGLLLVLGEARLVTADIFAALDAQTGGGEGAAPGDWAGPTGLVVSA